jgi:hypothetical protein
MGRDFILIIFRSILFILLQVLIFNKINLFDYINPLVYVLFVLFFPTSISKNNFLIISFLFGLSLDYFDNTGGAHALSCLTLAYFRPTIMKVSFGISFEFQSIKIIDKITPERISYFAFGILLHHLVFFTFEIFRWDMFFKILFKAIMVAIFTLLFTLLIVLVLRPRKN